MPVPPAFRRAAQRFRLLQRQPHLRELFHVRLQHGLQLPDPFDVLDGLDRYFCWDIRIRQVGDDAPVGGGFHALRQLRQPKGMAIALRLRIKMQEHRGVAPVELQRLLPVLTGVRNIIARLVRGTGLPVRHGAAEDGKGRGSQQAAQGGREQHRAQQRLFPAQGDGGAHERHHVLHIFVPRVVHGFEQIFGLHRYPSSLSCFCSLSLLRRSMVLTLPSVKPCRAAISAIGAQSQ